MIQITVHIIGICCIRLVDRFTVKGKNASAFDDERVGLNKITCVHEKEEKKNEKKGKYRIEQQQVSSLSIHSRINGI